MSKNRFAVIIYLSCGLSMESCGVLQFSGISLVGLVLGLMCQNTDVLIIIVCN